MKKLAYFLFCFISCVSLNAQQTTVINSTACAGGPVTITAPNAGSLTNVSYFLSPGNISSASGTFALLPYPSFTVFVTGINNQSAVVTDMVVYNYTIVNPPVLALQASTVSCGSPTIAVGATLTPAAPGATLFWSPAPQSINGNSTMATYGLGSPVTINVMFMDGFGCTGSSTLNIAPPPIPAFTVINPSGIYSITCANPVVQLQAMSNANLSYTWTNGGVLATTYSYNVSTPGSFSVIAADPLTGCTSSHSLSIGINTIAPLSLLTPTIQNITCLSGATTVSAIATPTANAMHQIISPYGGIFTANTFTTIYTPQAPGTYTHILVNQANGCSVAKTFTVTSNDNFPVFTLTTTSNYSLGCSSKSVATFSITNAASTIPPGGGPVSYTVLGPVPVNPGSYSITIPGTYTFIVKDNNNSCESKVAVSILQNTVAPDISVASNSAVITCNLPQVTLQGNSSTPNVSYSWTQGITTVPNISVAVSGLTATPNTSVIGTYTFAVQDNNNLCKSSQVVQVYQNIYPPKAQISVTGPAAITCAQPSVGLANVSTSGIPNGSMFPNIAPVIAQLWMGPIPSAPLPNSTSYMAWVPGVYTLTAKDINNGCISNTVITISDNRIFPAITPPVNPVILNCPGTASVPVTVVGPPNLTYTWTTPPSATVTGANSGTLVTNLEGVYHVIVTNTVSGCASMASYTVAGCVGLQKTNAENALIQLFPNPTSGMITVAAKSLKGKAELEVYNALGQLVHKQTLQGESTFDLGNQPNGLYLVYLRQNGSLLQTTRIIKK